jgi:hypothetical protein
VVEILKSQQQQQQTTTTEDDVALTSKTNETSSPSKSAAAAEYKKIKYWLKIAEMASGSCDKEEEFYGWVRNITKTRFPNDRQLAETLHATFPACFPEAHVVFDE